MAMQRTARVCALMLVCGSALVIARPASAEPTEARITAEAAVASAVNYVLAVQAEEARVAFQGWLADQVVAAADYVNAVAYAEEQARLAAQRRVVTPPRASDAI